MDTDGIGSHREMLADIARAYQIRSVVEFGLGAYSTDVFLNREVYKNLRVLITFEHDMSYVLDSLKNAPRGATLRDRRWRIILCHYGEFASALMTTPDLCFIDSGPTLERRAELCGALHPGAGIYVLHDYTSPLFDGFVKQFKYRAARPETHTIALSNKRTLEELK